MKSLLGIVLAGGLGAGTLLASGCASDGQGQTAKADTQTHAYTSGMMCPSCETTWVRERNVGGPRQITRFNSKREMTCPTCEATAQRVLLEDGDVQLHECPECKVTPKVIERDPRPSSSILRGGRAR